MASHREDGPRWRQGVWTPPQFSEPRPVRESLAVGGEERRVTAEGGHRAVDGSVERVSVAEFRASGLSVIQPVAESEWVRLADAVGRVSASDVVARIPLPPFDRSAVDGFAVRAADGQADRVVVGRVTAGHPAERPLGPGEAYEITTGAPLPPGADAVVLIEESVRDGNRVRLNEHVVAGLHVSPVGEDIRIGQRLLARDAVVNAAAVAALASQGFDRVAVWRRPRVAIVSTGDELTALGDPLRPGQVYDVNGATLEAMVTAAGGDPIRFGVLEDRYEAVRAGLEAAMARPDWDVLVTSGGTGASVPLFQGVDVRTLHDLIPAVVAELGTLIHHGIRMIPGRPTALGRLGGRPIFMLPGWPYAVLIHFELLVAPAIRRAAHRPPQGRPRLRAVLTEPLQGTPGFTRIIQVALEPRTGAPGWTARPLLPPPPPSASRVLTQMLDATGYVVVDESVRLVPGDPVDVFVDPTRWPEEADR
jgi:molybdenum cofactor synthesis domain-containing protein